MFKYKRDDMPELEAKLKEAIDTDGNFIQACGQRLLEDITGPDTGMVYEYDEQRLHLAEGYTFNEDGEVVRKSDVTGPGVQ